MKHQAQPKKHSDSTTYSKGHSGTTKVQASKSATSGVHQSKACSKHQARPGSRTGTTAFDK